MAVAAPKAFISYSWGSPERERWVLDLATQLRESGVDVILDKWDLKEGHDAIAFMEKMVTDPEIQKAIMVLDRLYAEKADGRKGGVGTEAQIITPEIYASTDQNKFVGVAAEVNDQGKPFLPAFYKSRIYIDLSSSEIYAANFEQLLRWIYDKPTHPKPPVGKPPSFLDENAVVLPTRSRAQRAIELLRSGSPQAMPALDDYVTTLAESFPALRLVEVKGKEFDDLVVDSINGFLPHRDEFIQVIAAFARSGNGGGLVSVHRFFELAIPYMYRPASMNQCTDVQFDNFKFIVHELFLYTIALLLKQERFDWVKSLMTDGYYLGEVPDFANDPIQPFTQIRKHAPSMERRNSRLTLRRLSVRADLLEERSHASGSTIRDLMQADFVLYLAEALAALKGNRRQKWYPETLLYFESHSRGPFEIFARAQSKRYFERIMPLLDITSKHELSEAFKHFGEDNARIYIPRWQFQSFSIDQAIGFDKLATQP